MFIKLRNILATFMIVFAIMSGAVLAGAGAIDAIQYVYYYMVNNFGEHTAEVITFASAVGAISAFAFTFARYCPDPDKRKD